MVNMTGLSFNITFGSENIKSRPVIRTRITCLTTCILTNVFSRLVLMQQIIEHQIHILFAGARSKRVIPVQIERCQTSNILNFVNPFPFYNLSMSKWQWPRVVATIKSELNPSLETRACPDIDPNEIQLDTSNMVYRQWWATTVACMPFADGVENHVTKTQRRIIQNVILTLKKIFD